MPWVPRKRGCAFEGLDNATNRGGIGVGAVNEVLAPGKSGEGGAE